MKILLNRSVIGLSIVATLGINCLSIFPGSLRQEVQFESEPSGVRIEILDGGHRLAEGTTPTKLDVPRHHFVARFSREDLRTTAIVMHPTDSRVLTSFLVSIPTLWFGTLIDLWTGAVSVHKPAQIRAQLEPYPSSVPKSDAPRGKN